jgi:hypothetical protein
MQVPRELDDIGIDRVLCVWHSMASLSLEM